MKSYIQHHEWKVIEDGFHPQWNKVTESLCSLGNGYMGHRGNFEEHYSGEKLQGSYLAGIYYPDKTRVGWWKNGYPEYFAKVLNAVNWIGIDVKIGEEVLDIAKGELLAFRRSLDMKNGVLDRHFELNLGPSAVQVRSQRLCHIKRKEIGLVKYSIRASDFKGKIALRPYLDFDVWNEDTNYDEQFWIGIDARSEQGKAVVIAETKKTKFRVAAHLRFELFLNDVPIAPERIDFQREKYAASTVEVDVKQGDVLSIVKYVSIVHSENHDEDALFKVGSDLVEEAEMLSYEKLYDEHAEAWSEKWRESDILIEGDVAAQQGIRFNIFHLNQTYSGEDERLNIGPKGFTGEKYGGSTYWDTEAYCLPFYLSTADKSIARNLLMYRYRHLGKAIENAGKLGFNSGAALYPMVTMTGEECHNEWEITFEEIHRNGAIAYAIHDYTRYTGDKTYLQEYGLEVLIGICRFWAQRVQFSKAKQQYVILGVTGPNEYENNVNNNWYTNYIAVWCLRYTYQCLLDLNKEQPERFNELQDKLNFKFEHETKLWGDIIEKMYFPYNEKEKLFLQQDGFLDKHLMLADELSEEIRPIHQNWSWDRILRSCFIKQADTLQGMFFFEEEFDVADIRRHFHYYEPMTVHESSLSPCVHAILAALIGDHDKAYEMYLRTARLDLDDYNNDTEDGLHITSMGGTWMAFVKGFSGMRVKNDKLYFNPFIPENWQSYSFKIRFRSHLLKITADKNGVQISNESDMPLSLYVHDQLLKVGAKQMLKAPYSVMI